jgi:sorbitol-6-phosphate 2-dehydrogenase
MSEIDHSFAAPLVRGLYLEAFGRPLVIVPSETPAAPGEALSVEIAPGIDESAAADAFRAALAAWRSKRASAMPGCVFVRSGSWNSAYWPGFCRDEAARRAQKADSSPLAALAAEIPAGSTRDENQAGSARAENQAGSARAENQAGSARRRGEVVSGRVALVTGGAQGFGEEIVRGLCSSGAIVYVADLNLAGAEKLSASLNAEAKATIAFPVAVNVSDEASVAAMFAAVAARTGGLDLVVSNAGVLKASSVLEQDADSFKFVTDVNYVGFMLVTKHAGLLMRRQHLTAPGWSTDIIQINSKSGLEGSNKNGSYAGSKFGGIGLVQSYALELVDYRIKVNAICPGNFLDGPLWSDPVKGLFVQYLRSGKVKGAKTVDDVRRAYEAKVPMGRGCEGADVMRAVYYIVEQEYETGQALPVTGGQVMLS